MTAEQLGPLLRLWGVSTTQLPPHDAASSDLAPFLSSLLGEALPFIDSAAPQNGPAGDAGLDAPKAWKPKHTKTYSQSTAPVHVSERTVSSASLERIKAEQGGRIPALSCGGITETAAETWACRRSVHADAAERGTASWGEFTRCFKERHSEAEEAFTPEVVASRTARSWDCRGMEVDVDLSGYDAREGGKELWTDFRMVVQEMRHKIAPAGTLRDRVFGVLTVSAEVKGRDEFIIISVHLPDVIESDMGGLVKQKGVVVGAYTSVERIRRMKSGRVDEARGLDPRQGQAARNEIEWLMATASDARGVLPLWVQSKAVVGVVAKDVQLFLGWIAQEREKGPEEKAEVLKDLPVGPSSA